MLKKSTVAEALALGLKRHGVEVMFSQSLPSAVLLAAEELGIRQYAYRTENAGTAMADGYARISGKVSVVTAQNGPAATLLVPGLAEAMKASIPIVALVQDVNVTQADKNAFQELDHLGLFQACTKWARILHDPKRALDYLDMAFANAASGRPGPVALMLPADLLNQTIEIATPRTANLGTYPLDRTMADPVRIAEAADLIAAAKRPLVVSGGGVHISGASAEVAELQVTFGLPVVTTVMGKGTVDDRHPLTVGVSGYAMGKLAPARHMRELVVDADVVLLVGTKTNQNGTDSWTLYPDGARYIHIDVDGAEIGRNYEALRLTGDAKLTLAELIRKLDGRRTAQPAVATKIADAKARHRRDMEPIFGGNEGPARPERLMQDLQRFLAPDSIVVADASYSSLWIALYLEARTPGARFITPRGLAGLGWGLPLAMGAKVARPGAAVFAVVGDGGFGHVWGELETCARMRTPVVITVLNNGILGYQKHAENAKFGAHTTACYFAPVDHAAIARAAGCRGVRVEAAGDYAAAVEEALAHPGATLIDVITDARAFPPVTLFDALEGKGD